MYIGDKLMYEWINEWTDSELYLKLIWDSYVFDDFKGENRESIKGRPLKKQNDSNLVFW